MAAAQHTVGCLPNTHRRSFAEVITAKHHNFPAPAPQITESTDPYPLQTGLHKGYPAAIFTSQQLKEISSTYDWSLVGKFSMGYNKNDPEKGRPSLERLHSYLLTLNLKGEFNIGLLDNRHVIIHLSSEEDYIRLYSRMIWYIGKVVMRIFRWTPYFRVDKESPLVPVWITFPRLPIMFFQQRVLFSVAQLIGRPLRTDNATAMMKRPSVARLLVEIDLLKSHPEKIWIQLGDSDGYWQQVTYENVPEYCSHCWHVGHSQNVCHVQNPELRKIPQQLETQAYVVKNTILDKGKDIAQAAEKNQQESPIDPVNEEPSILMGKKPTTTEETSEGTQPTSGLDPPAYNTLSPAPLHSSVVDTTAAPLHGLGMHETTSPVRDQRDQLPVSEMAKSTAASPASQEMAQSPMPSTAALVEGNCSAGRQKHADDLIVEFSHYNHELASSSMQSQFSDGEAAVISGSKVLSVDQPTQPTPTQRNGLTNKNPNDKKGTAGNLAQQSFSHQFDLDEDEHQRVANSQSNLEKPIRLHVSSNDDVILGASPYLKTLMPALFKPQAHQPSNQEEQQQDAHIIKNVAILPITSTAQDFMNKDNNMATTSILAEEELEIHDEDDSTQVRQKRRGRPRRQCH